MRIRKRFLALLAIVLIASTVYAAPPIVRLAPLTISIATNTTTVTTDATALPAIPLVGRENITISLNDTSDTVYIGGNNVTTATGTPLDSSRPAASFDTDDSVIWYGIVSSGTADVRTLEIK